MKRMSRYFCFLLALFWLHACNADTDKPIVFKGHYIYGLEVNSFQPCNQKAVYWVIGTLAIHQALEDAHDKYTTEPYEEVYAEVQGTLIGKATDGFAADYDDQLRVNKILLIKEKSEKDCQPKP